MTESSFVSERITPLPGRFAAAAMVRGEPGLPEGFVWRGRTVRIRERLAVGRRTGPSAGESYVRRHTFRLRMEDDAIWEVYFTRQPPLAWYLFRTTGG